MTDFKFKVGDIVAMQVGVTQAKASLRFGEYAMPNHFMVVGTILDECPGSGPQRKYILSEGAKNFQCHEVELVAEAEVPIDEMIDAWIEIRTRIRQADMGFSPKSEK
jgi:hypothetical protein